MLRPYEGGLGNPYDRVNVVRHDDEFFRARVVGSANEVAPYLLRDSCILRFLEEEQPTVRANGHEVSAGSGIIIGRQASNPAFVNLHVRDSVPCSDDLQRLNVNSFVTLLTQRSPRPYALATASDGRWRRR